MSSDFNAAWIPESAAAMTSKAPHCSTGKDMGRLGAAAEIGDPIARQLRDVSAELAQRGITEERRLNA